MSGRHDSNLSDDARGGRVVFGSDPPSIRPETLRDEFAMAALTGVVQAYATGSHRWAVRAQRAAVRAYVVADAMLAERSKR